MRLRYFPAARKDIKEALRWSAANFGLRAMQRYKTLIPVSLSEIADNPNLQFSYVVRGLQPGIRIYHLKHSRQQALVDGQIVKSPRHFIIYKVESAQVTIVRILHGRMEILPQIDTFLR